MTQVSATSISLNAKSTEFPIAWDVMPVGDAQLAGASGSPLVLIPGKPSEVLLRSRNQSDHPVQLSLSIRGNFHARWLKAIASDTNAVIWSQDLAGQATDLVWRQTLEPQAAVQEVLVFEIPDDFFEDQSALAHQSALQLQFQSELFLYAAMAGGTSSPRLAGHHLVDLYIRPNATYIDFLPEIYQQSDFITRFLTIFEQAFDPSVQTLDDFWAYLDPLTAPKALIPFLAEWVAWPLNPRWTLKQQRWLIRHAVELYQWRGTRYGLQLALSLITGLPNDENHIYIQEDHQADFVLGEISLADSPMLGGGQAFHFSVRLRPEASTPGEYLEESMIRAIIEQEKPAFCTYDLTIEDPI